MSAGDAAGTMSAGLALALAGAGAWAVSGVPVLLARRRTVTAERAAAAVALAGSGLGLGGAALALTGSSATATMAWTVPGGSLSVGLDVVSALFLLPVFLVPGLAAVYGLGYAPANAAGGHGPALRTFQGVLTAGMALLLLARNSLLFLVGWEAMALAAFFLIAAEHHIAAARRAAWVYLVATHLGTASLIAAFALLSGDSGNLDWSATASTAASPARAAWVFALALLGFGLKAGVMPLHVWLPAAHANAPSHVSAVLSGVMIKMGVYGMVRVGSLLPPLPPACGVVLIVLGAATALAGVAATLAQRDLKRLLAYSSIENIGIVFTAIGLGELGRSLGMPELVVLGLGGALLHVLNHGLFKPLLFLGAGSVIHATGTRDLDRLGGLLRRMPRTGLAFAVGAASICGLPLLNGFAGEYLLYVGLFHGAASPRVWLALLTSAAIAVLALVGGLAVAGFVRCTAAVFLGQARATVAARAHESPASMTGPLLLLATLCIALGVAPWLAAGLVSEVLASTLGPAPTAAAAAFAALPGLGAIASACVAAAGLGVWWHCRRRASGATTRPAAGTWDCGYVDATSPRLQYTASSFAQFSTRLLPWTVREREQRPVLPGLFPGASAFARRALEPLLDGLLWPIGRRLADRCARLRILQVGNLQIYLLYVLVVLLVLFGWSALAAGSAR